MKGIKFCLCLLIISQIALAFSSIGRSVQATDLSSNKGKSSVTIQVIDQGEKEDMDNGIDSLPHIDVVKEGNNKTSLPTTGESWSFLHILIGIAFLMLAIAFKLRTMKNK
ncbi:hypothetical protein [Carnobacterium maltaromaticum]|uniref:hypothetical protein n=1 Tax=Carnobacterium maltaromaticum TaxID=2751 RepID=UPI00295F44D3|nr:hypothetical protein [Carnobacterium maltaromaticum]